MNTSVENAPVQLDVDSLEEAQGGLIALVVAAVALATLDACLAGYVVGRELND